MSERFTILTWSLFRVLKHTIETNKKEKALISLRNYSEVTLIKLKSLSSQAIKNNEKLKAYENKLAKAQLNLRLITQKVVDSAATSSK